MIHAQSILGSIAEQVVGAQKAMLPPALQYDLRMAVIDAVGRILAGTGRDTAKAVLAAQPAIVAEGGARIFGTDRKTSPLDAAFIHALAFADDQGGQRAASPPHLPALIGLAEQHGRTGGELILALALGGGIARGLAGAVGRDGESGELHRSWTVGLAAAGARLAGLDAPAAAAALANAISLAAPSGDVWGRDTLSLAQASRAGILAVILAENGIRPGENFLSNAAVFKGNAADTVFDWTASPASKADDHADPWERFEERARSVLPREQIAPLFDLLDGIGSVGDIAQLTRLAAVSTLYDPDRAKQKIKLAPNTGQDAPETTWVP